MPVTRETRPRATRLDDSVAMQLGLGFGKGRRVIKTTHDWDARARFDAREPTVRLKARLTKKRMAKASLRSETR